MDRIALETPAKINYFLEVTGKRPDGYHELVTVFQAVEFTDRLLLEKQETPGVSLTEEEGLIPVPLDETNLMSRAAKLMFDRYALPGGLSIRFRKEIFTGAGLGGGSSDAAAVLYGIDRLFGLGLSKEELKALGVRLGADVPFFFEGGTCLATGIGETLTKLGSLPPFPLVIVKPDASASTKEIFQAFDREPGRTVCTADRILQAFSDPEDEAVTALSGALYNALEDVTVRFVPEVAEIRRDLLENGAFGALMSGSGSSVFGIFKDRKTAENAFLRVSPGRNACLTETTPNGIIEIPESAY